MRRVGISHEAPHEPMRDYFVYLPQQPPGNIWGCTATSVGFARVAPRASIRRRGILPITILNGLMVEFFSATRSSLSPKAPEFSRVSTRSGESSREPCFFLFPGVWHPVYSGCRDRMGRALDRVSRPHLRRSRSDGNCSAKSTHPSYWPRA